MIITQGFLSGDLISGGFVPFIEPTPTPPSPVIILPCHKSILCQIGNTMECTPMLYIRKAYLPAITCCCQNISLNQFYE